MLLYLKDKILYRRKKSYGGFLVLASVWLFNYQLHHHYENIYISGTFCSSFQEESAYQVGDDKEYEEVTKALSYWNTLEEHHAGVWIILWACIFQFSSNLFQMKWNIRGNFCVHHPHQTFPHLAHLTESLHLGIILWVSVNGTQGIVASGKTYAYWEAGADFWKSFITIFRENVQMQHQQWKWALHGGAYKVIVFRAPLHRCLPRQHYIDTHIIFWIKITFSVFQVETGYQQYVYYIWLPLRIGITKTSDMPNNEMKQLEYVLVNECHNFHFSIFHILWFHQEFRHQEWRTGLK